MTVRSNEPDDDTSTRSSGSDADSVDIDLEEIGQWCQNFLHLFNEELDCLWYERLAEAAANVATGIDPVKVRKYYEHALEWDDVSWLCDRGLGKTYF